MELNEGYSTKSKQFAAKVRVLKDFAKENAVITQTGRDVINNLKYFQSTLIAWVKDKNSCFIPSQYKFDGSKFPHADYQELFNTVFVLLKHSESLEETEDLCDALVTTIACTVPFLLQETILELPLIIAETLYDISQPWQTKLIDLLVQYIIPLIYAFMTPDINDEMADMNLCVPSVLASVLDAADIGACAKVMESLMRFKIDVSSDLLTVLAYGTRESLESSVHLLNRYFPPVDIGSVKAYQSPSYESILPYMCQSDLCKNAHSQKEAVKLCLDPSLCALYNDQPPPMYFCQGCYSALGKTDSQLFLNVVQPVSLVSQVCDNVDCRFGFMKALYFCFSLECTKKNDYKPIRLCEDCHSRLHVGPNISHMNHQCLKELWTTPNPEQTYLVDAIVRLWTEAQPEYHVKCARMGVEMENVFLEQSKQQDPMAYLKKIFRSFHGLDLLKTTCPLPPSQFHLEHLTRLIAMLLVWIESVEYATHPKAVPIVKQKKKQAIGWINKILQYDVDLYASCLLPSPPLAARVGHPWELFTSVVRKDLEILQRLVNLTKQELICEQVWDQIMPEWMQEIKDNVPVDDISIFKKVLGNLFDLESEVRPPYAINFIDKRLESSLVKQSQEGLVWVQILSYLDVKLHIKKLLEKFIEMVITNNDVQITNEHSIPTAFPFPDQFALQDISSGNRLSRQNSSNITTPVSSSLPILKNVKDDLSVSILMMDVLIKQLTLQKGSDGCVYIAPKENTRLSVLLVCVLDQSFKGTHNGHQDTECPHCKVMSVIFYQISLLVDLVVRQQVVVSEEKSEYSKSIIWKTSSNASKTSCISPENSVTASASTETFAAHSESINSVIMEEEKEEDEEEELLKTEDKNDGDEMEKNIKELKKHLEQLPSKVDVDEIMLMQQGKTDLNSSSLYSIPELQILEKLVQQLEQVPETSVMVHILTSLDILCCRGECLKMVAEEDIELLRKLQNLALVPCLWKLLKSSCSNIAQRVVPLLLHCCCLPFGAERLCSELEKDFTSEEWKDRFAAVDKVGLMCQFVSDEYICNSPYARSVVVYGMVFLTHAFEDISTMVATRARSVIQSINITSLKVIYKYMEEHFSCVGDDRLTLLHSYRVIHMIIPESSPTSAEFFLMLFKKMKSFEEKKRKLFRDPTIVKEDDNDNGGLLPMFNRRFPSNKTKFFSAKTSPTKLFGKIGFVPLKYYKETFTLQARKQYGMWEGHLDRSNDTPAHYKHMMSSDISPAVEIALDTVSEECENELKQTLSVQPTVTGDAAPTEEEVLSLLIAQLVEFLSTKQKDKIDYTLGRTSFNEIQHIITYIGFWMGLERTVTQRWLTPQKMSIKRFRKNPIFVTFLMHLPKLLDGNKEYGEFFLYLALQVMETCIKRNPGDDLANTRLSLIHLEPHLQHSWLTALIVILYKHSFQDHENAIWNFIHVVKNTIDGHGKHICGFSKAKESISMRHLVNMKVAMKKKIKKQHMDAGKSMEMQDLTGISFTESPSQTSTLDSRIQGPVSESHNPHLPFLESTEDLVLSAEYKACALCGIALFQYDEETINLAIVALLTFIHMDATHSAPLVIDTILSITRKAKTNSAEKSAQGCLSPTASIAQQFLRCVYEKLAQSRLFPELFRIENLDDDFFLMMASVLQDFDMLTQLSPIKLSLQDINESKSADRITIFLNNLSKYVKIVQHHAEWEDLQSVFDTFLINTIQLIPNQVKMDCLLDIMSMLLNSQKTTFRVLIDLIDNTMSHIVKNCLFGVKSLQDICTACIESFSRDRDQTRLTKKVSLILTMVLSSKLALSEEAVANLIQFFCTDVGTRCNFDLLNFPLREVPVKKYTKAVETLDVNYNHEVIEYLKTPLRRVKECHFNEKLINGELYQSTIKLSVAQFIAVHISQANDSRFHSKLLSFLVCNDGHDSLMNQLVSLDVQEFVMQFRIYCWIILGTLYHSYMTEKPLIVLCSPGKALLVSELIRTVFKSFLEGEENFSKTKTRSQLHFSFLLAQIWTVYIEGFIVVQVNQTSDVNPIAMIKEFWSCLTPVVYQLLQHQKQLHLETIQLFSSLVENISIHCPRSFTQLYPLWEPLLKLYVNEIPPHIVRKIDVGAPGDMMHGESRKEVYRQWLVEMQKQLWSTERMSKGKIATNSIMV